MTASPRFSTPGEELEYVKSIVGKYFPIYDVKVSFDTVAFYCRIDEQTFEQNFDELRRELVPQNYIPLVRIEKGAHVIYVGKRPSIKYRSTKINAVLLIITIITTVLAGAANYAEYDGITTSLRAVIAASLTPKYLLLGGIFFALPLLVILSVHEMAHYFASKRHGIKASLPFFIPVPPYFSPLGTFGAFISVREPIPNKKALMDIGSAGPIAGFIAAIPITLIGLYLTGLYPHPAPEDVSNALYLGSSMFYSLLAMLVPTPDNVVIHPMAFAGWVGLLVTALNLLPAGQLDGGHIAQALFGEKAKYLGYATLITMFMMGIFYTSWLIFALLIIFLGLRHPPPLNSITKLDSRRNVLGAIAIIMLLICFVPMPMYQIEPKYEFKIVLFPDENYTKNVTLGEYQTFNFTLNNTGNAGLRIKLVASKPQALGMHSKGFLRYERAIFQNMSEVIERANANETLEVSLGVKSNVNITFVVSVGDELFVNKSANFTITAIHGERIEQLKVRLNIVR